jgi:hypothetical protein
LVSTFERKQKSVHTGRQKHPPCHSKSAEKEISKPAKPSII